MVTARKPGALVASLVDDSPDPVFYIRKAVGPGPIPMQPPLGQATGPSNHTPEMPDFESLFASPESQTRQKQEGKQSRDRRRSMWRDHDVTGLHGSNDGEPELRYIKGVTSTADVANMQPRHFLTAAQLQAGHKRIREGSVLGYEEIIAGGGKSKKKGKVKS